MTTLPLDTIDADMLIIGAGGAGLMAAMHAYELNPKLRIVVVVKGLLGQSGCTRRVQGGYNAVLNPNDSLERHFADTIKGGAFLNNQELAWTLVAESPSRIVELENKAGCIFDRNPDGTIHQKPFAGQSFDRTVHKGDLTGIEIMSNLRDYTLESGIQVLQECRGLDLLTNDGKVGGALLLNIRTGRLIAARAKATLLATGGGATMYRISSPSLEKSGDGMAMARRAGAKFVDMEMLQFHPTGLLVGRSIATGGLLEEGLRGAGAQLYNGLGERYMEKYDSRLERATRDVVSRSSYLEVMAGRGSPAGGVFIDVTHLGEKFLLENFPGMVERCADYGFDMVHERVEVSPSAHFQMGGVQIDTQCHASLDGLFAAGEDAGGVHGANRLGGNGVADSIVFGGVAGDAMTDYVQNRAMPTISDAQVRELGEHWTRSLSRTSGEKPFPLRQKLEDLMWEKVGVARNGGDLQKAQSEIATLREHVKRVATPGPAASNSAWNALMDLANLCDVGQLVAQAALVRTESRGAHYRLDYKTSNNDEWLKNIVLTPSGDSCDVHYEAVQFTRMAPPPPEPATTAAAS
jgi:succinate dehydrogenase / fumarate reductase flavoprotein subunit/fumarate reductase flavoprotein subunit